MAISFPTMMSVAAPPPASTASASLSLLSIRCGGGSLGRASFVFSKPTSATGRCSPALLHTSFLSSPSPSLSFPSSFSGLSLGLDLQGIQVRQDRYRRLQVKAAKAALSMTKRSRSRKSLARTHGFRRRMRTTTGRAILKRRRAKGRKVLCTKTNPNRGK